MLVVSVAGMMCFTSIAAAQEAAHYSIQANVDLANKKIHATQRVAYTNYSKGPFEEIYFHIYPNREYSLKEKSFILRYGGYFRVNPFPEGFHTGALQLHAIKLGDQTLSYHIEGKDKTILKVTLPKSLAPGERIEIDLDFSVDIPHVAYGRFGWHKDIVKLSQWYPILTVHNENGWNNHPFYPFHRPFFTEASTYSVQLNVPQKQVVVHSGQKQREEVSSDGTKTLFIETPLATREFSLAMSPAYKVYEEDFNGVKIKSFYLPGTEFYGQMALKDAKDLFAFYTERFGPYPYQEFSIVPVHLGYGGEQMSNIAFIDTRVYRLPKFLKRYFDFLISHETGHQWFYNLVGMDEYQEMWLEEGMNSYFISEYLEKKYGPKAEIIDYPYWLKKWKGFFPELTFERTRDFRYKTITRVGFDHAIVGELSSFQEPSSIFSLTYGKGSRIVGMLRAKVGDETFDRIFKKVTQQFRMKNLSVKEFVQICEAESGQDLKSFFNQWLNSGKQLNYAVDGVAGKKRNRIVFVNRGQITGPVDYKVKTFRGEEQIFQWDGEKKREEIELKDPIKEVSIDPYNQWLDMDRVNNHWPRKVYVKPVPLYFGLYDLPLFLPEDSYNVVVGPEILSNGIGIKTSIQRPYDQILYGATGYEFGEQFHKSRIGYQLNNVFHKQVAVGFEITNRTDLDGGEEDLVTGKAYIRRELWPTRYGLADNNDHATLYLIRNRGVDGILAMDAPEDTRNISYLRREEAIVGTLLHLGRSGPYPDPQQGYNLDMMIENAGHFLGATQYFNRASADFAFYQSVTTKTRLAFRLKSGLGYPHDKNLFQLGGADGLRGFDRKTIRGSNALLGSLEYRFPVLEDLHLSLFDNILGLESIGGVAFFDIGQAWFSSFPSSDLKKDAGLGLRFTVTAGSFLEKIIVRLDAARPINEPDDDDTRFWFGINHVF